MRQKRKIVLYLTILILISSISILSYREINQKESIVNKTIKLIKEKTNTISKTTFNMKFINAKNIDDGYSLKKYINNVIDSNTKNPDHKIIIIYKNTIYENKNIENL